MRWFFEVVSLWTIYTILKSVDCFALLAMTKLKALLSRSGAAKPPKEKGESGTKCRLRGKLTVLSNS
jgi:hypothetical protein